MRRPNLEFEPLPPRALNPLEVGQWIRWTTPEHVFEGEVVEVDGPSAVFHFIGRDGQTVIPVVEGYFPPVGTGIEVIPKPKHADRVARDQASGRMTVARAAAMLGVEPKRVRAMLRAGSLGGAQTDGRWTHVDVADVQARVDHAE